VLHYRAELQLKNVSLQIQRPVCSGLRKKEENIGHPCPTLYERLFGINENL
jgi:hypothetical protein